MQIEAYGATDVGLRREHNEDYHLTRPELGLHVVCDGMGGHAAGEVASALAAKTLAREVEQRAQALRDYDGSPEGREALVALVRECVEAASRTVYEHACSEHGRAGMGTTLIMLLTVGEHGVMGHVGDSRLYMARDGELHQLSEDHNYVVELIKHGLPPEQARRSAFAHRLTRAVGIQETVQVDTLLFDILPGDTFLLCSDGLTNHVEEPEELVALLSEGERAGLPERLVALANERGGSDNITALVVHARAEGDADDAARTTEVNLRLNTLQHISLFADMTLAETVAVLSKLRSMHVASGQEVVREGEHDERLFIILDGALAVTRDGVELTQLRAGDHFGEMALVSHRPRSASVRVVEASRLLIMERQDFDALVSKEPALGVKLLHAMARVLSERLDEANLLPMTRARS